MVYLNFRQSKATYSVKYILGGFFYKIETVFFSALCLFFLVNSKLNTDFSKSVSFSIVGISIPIAKTAAFPFNVIINLLTDFKELVNAKEENKYLKKEIEEFRSFYIETLNIRNENKQLQRELNFANLRFFDFKAARVIGKSHPIFGQKIFIDAGENIDIKEGSVVINNHGMIGRILQVGDKKSEVTLLTDVASRIPVITSKSRVKAVLAGSNSGLMELLYLPRDHNIEVGDWVFTSGDGDTLPSGLLVGVVKKVDQDYVLVAMAEDANSADIVLIVSY